MTEKIRKESGGYRNLKSYQNAEIIYDFTVEFCQKYIDMTDRTNRTDKSRQGIYKLRQTEQMEQAARSGKQNIVEASSFARTSSKSELKLLGVSRASLEELLEDFRDFLRQRGLREWSKDGPSAQAVRALAYMTDRTYTTYKSYMAEAEKATNAAICLINQTNYLLDRQISALEQKFIKEGGYSEELFKKRQEEKKRQIVGNWQARHFG